MGIGHNANTRCGNKLVSYPLSYIAGKDGGHQLRTVMGRVPTLPARHPFLVRPERAHEQLHCLSTRPLPANLWLLLRFSCLNLADSILRGLLKLEYDLVQ
jgi:hypothetical protein